MYIFGDVNHFIQYMLGLNFLAPVFSGISCMILILLSYGDSLTRTELEIKKIMVFYLFCAAFSWLTIFVFGYFPEGFVLLNTPAYLTYLYTQVLLYRLFYVFTRLNESDCFSRQHYLAPALVGGALLVWSFFVPYEVQAEIVRSKGIARSVGYEAYTFLFLSKPMMRLLFSIIYITLTLVRLRKYYHHIKTLSNEQKQPAGWVFFLGALMVTSVLSSSANIFLTRAEIFNTMFIGIASLVIIAQHILLTGLILHRKYMSYITFPGRIHIPLKSAMERQSDVPHFQTPEAQMEGIAQSQRYLMRHPAVKNQHNSYVHKPLTHQNFEKYMNRHRPYTNKELRITELAAALNTNRSYLSRFVNKTYGVNFNRYINRCRLEELRRLANLPSNSGERLRDLVGKAGFSDYKHYSRALRTEKEADSASTERINNNQTISGNE